MLYQRDTVLRDLRNNVVEIHYDADGKPMVFRGTLQKEMLPLHYKINEEKKFHEENPNVVVMWDMSFGGFKSFNVEYITYCTAVHAY